MDVEVNLLGERGHRDCETLFSGISSKCYPVLLAPEQLTNLTTPDSKKSPVQDVGGATICFRILFTSKVYTTSNRCSDDISLRGGRLAYHLDVEEWGTVTSVTERSRLPHTRLHCVQ